MSIDNFEVVKIGDEWDAAKGRIKEHMNATAEEKRAIYKELCTGRVWARIMKGDKEAIGRIGMVTEIITDRDKILLSIRILSRKIKRGSEGEYLWGEASWTRKYYPIEALDLFRLPGSGYTVWVPKMVHNGNVDGGCHVDPSKWVWYGAYTGPQKGEGAGKDKEYKLQEEA